MVICWSQKNLVLLTLTFPLLCVKGYAEPSPVDQEQYKAFILKELTKLKKNEHWTGLENDNKANVIKVGLLANSEIKLPPEEIKRQFELHKDKERKEALDAILKANSAQKTPIPVPTDELKKQIDLLGNESNKFLNEVLTENSVKETPIMLSIEVLEQQLNLYGVKREEILNKYLKETKARLTPEILNDQYQLLDDPEEFLKARLDEYEPTDRQDLINSLLEIYTNKQLLQNPSDEKCKKIGENSNPTYIGATQVIDWLNTAHFKGFFQPTMTYALVNGDTFNDFDTFNQWNLWIEPFGFYTQFRRDAAPLKFNMYTAGISVGGEYTFFDRLVLGLGLAYSHSGVTWQDLHSLSEDKEKESKKTSEDKRKKLHSTANLNSIYFGPSLSYVFSHGYLSCTIFGVANFYQVDRETNLFPDKILKPNKSTPEYNSWDIVGRLEGGLSYEVGGDFFLYPTAKVDYLHVIMPDSIEAVDDDTELSIEALNGSFLNSKIGLKATRQFFYDSIGYLIPSLSAGLINFTPLSNNSYHYKIGECDKFEEKLKIGSWNQSYFGAGFAIVHKRGVLVSLDYELTVGADSPLHAANLRVEWSW